MYALFKVREIRRAVLLNRTADDCDSDTEWENQEIDSQATGTTRETPRPGTSLLVYGF